MHFFGTINIHTLKQQLGGSPGQDGSSNGADQSQLLLLLLLLLLLALLVVVDNSQELHYAELGSFNVKPPVPKPSASQAKVDEDPVSHSFQRVSDRMLAEVYDAGSIAAPHSCIVTHMWAWRVMFPNNFPC